MSRRLGFTCSEIVERIPADCDPGVSIEVANWAVQNGDVPVARQLAEKVWKAACDDSAAVWQGESHPRVAAIGILWSAQSTAQPDIRALLDAEREPQVARKLFDLLDNQSQADRDSLARSYGRALERPASIGVQAVVIADMFNDSGFGPWRSENLRKRLMSAIDGSLGDSRLSKLSSSLLLAARRKLEMAVNAPK